MRSRSNSSLFLIELIIALLFFSVCSAICVNVFAKSALLAKNARASENAVLLAETAAAADLFARPLHPYTAGLLDSLPRMDDAGGRLKPIEGSVPSPLACLPGCRFAPRCPRADSLCTHAVPPMRDAGNGHAAACHHPLEAARC